MALTTAYSLTSFDSATAILLLRIRILDGTTVIETVNEVPVRLPVDIYGAVPTGAALDEVLNKAVSGMFTPKILAEKERLYRITQAGGAVVNAAEIAALTEQAEPEETLVTAMVGYVYDQLGNPVYGATVTTDATMASATTNFQGHYYFVTVSGAQKITAEKAGYILSEKTVTVIALTHCDLRMSNAAGIQSTTSAVDMDTQDTTVTNTARPADNAEVFFPTGAVVDSMGNPVSAVNIDIANITVSDPGAIASFPGYFLGTPLSGPDTPIESFGFIKVDLFEDGSGTRLQLDPAVGATVRLPVNPDPVGFTTIPTWRLNETTGIWEETGIATRVGSTNVFEFTVDSFSWHNLDQPLPMSLNTLIVNAFDDRQSWDGRLLTQTPAVGVDITVAVREGYYWDAATIWEGRGTTDINGQLILTVPTGWLRVTGKKGIAEYNGSGYTEDGLGNANVDLYYFLPPELPPTSNQTADIAAGTDIGIPTSTIMVENLSGQLIPNMTFSAINSAMIDPITIVWIEQFSETVWQLGLDQEITLTAGQQNFIGKQLTFYSAT